MRTTQVRKNVFDPTSMTLLSNLWLWQEICEPIDEERVKFSINAKLVETVFLPR